MTALSHPRLLAIDGGTEGARVGVFDLAGKLLAHAAESYPTSFPRPGWAEQDPDHWWTAVAAATRACLQSAGLDGSDIGAISLDATTCTLLALNADGRVLRPALLWMDVRAGRQAEAIFQTGHPALCYSPSAASAEWMLAKVIWLKENEPAVYDATAHFLDYADWLVWRLTGRLALNQCTATQRLYYHGRNWRWPLDLFAAAGVPDLNRRLPTEVIPLGEPAGTLGRAAADALGLRAETPVYEGGGDAFVGLLGLNVAQPGKVGLITGSSNVMCTFAFEEFHAPGLFGAFPDSVVPGLCLVEAGQVSAGSILAWFKRGFAADLPSDAAYRILDGEARRVPPGSNGLIVLDYFQGNRTPHTDPHAEGAIWGLTLHTTRGSLFRALMEGIAFGANEILQTLAAHGHPAEEIITCGGATRSDLFMQIYADVCGLPLATTTVADAPLLGGAVLAATGLGAYKDMRQASETMVRRLKTYLPDPARHEAYQFYFRQYQATYGQLRGLMHATAGHVHSASSAVGDP